VQFVGVMWASIAYEHRSFKEDEMVRGEMGRYEQLGGTSERRGASEAVVGMSCWHSVSDILRVDYNGHQVE